MTRPATLLSTLIKVAVLLWGAAFVAPQCCAAAGEDAAKATDGRLATLLHHGLGRPTNLHPTATVEGCIETAAPRVVEEPGKRVTILRHLREEKGNNSCTLTESFSHADRKLQSESASVGPKSVRWEIEIQGLGTPWSRPIVADLRYATSQRTRYWMAWEGLAGADPMVPVPIKEGGGVVYSYGGSRYRLDRPFVVWDSWSPWFRKPYNERFVSVPIATWIEPGQDGLSLAASPEPMQFDLEITMEKDGEARFRWFHHRIAKDSPPVKLALDLVAHEDDWRGGMRSMVDRYRDYFEPPNPSVGSWVGCGQYARARTDLDVDELKRMDFTLNWNAEFDFPYMGMFVPPVGPNEQWLSWYKERTSFQKMEAYAAWMKKQGFHVLQYFNFGDFGSKTVFPRPSAGNHDVWKLPDWRNPDEFLAARLWSAVVRVPGKIDLKSMEPYMFRGWGKARPDGLFYSCWDDTVVVDCGEPVYHHYLIDQANRLLDIAPSSSGICLDRVDRVRYYNLDGDDGLSWFDGAPARSLVWSWRRLMDRLGPMVHDRGKTIFVSALVKRLDLMRHVDAFHDEFSDGGCIPGTSWIALAKPVVVFHGLIKDDAEFQELLHWGVYPQVPCPGNDHGCPHGTPADRTIYQDYGPLLKLMRGRKWVLEPHCIAVVEGKAKANLFKVADGWVVPVTMGPREGIVNVAICNVPGITEKSRMEAFHPGVGRSHPVSVSEKDGRLELTVPVKRGCAMVKIEG